MSTCPVVSDSILSTLSPETLAWLETPFTIEDGPPIPPKPTLKNSFASALWDEGLTDKSLRAERAWKISRGYRGASGKTWRDNESSSMLRTDPQVAYAKSRDKRKQLQYFRKLTQDGFTTLQFQFRTHLLSLDPQETREQLVSLRAALKPLLPLAAADYIGAGHGHPTLSVLLETKLNQSLLRSIQSLTPPSIKFTYSYRQPDTFQEDLTNLVDSALPENARSRARFENILEGIHQSKTYNVPKEWKEKEKEEETDKIVLSEGSNTNLSSDSPLDSSPAPAKSKPKVDPEKHRNPITREIPLWVTLRKFPDTADLDSLEESEWQLIT